MHAEYWEQFESLEEMVRREVYLNDSGLRVRPSISSAFSRYSDVWRAEALDELAAESRDAYISRDRHAATTALGGAIRLRLAGLVAALDEEIAAHDARSTVPVGSGEMAFRTAEFLSVHSERTEARRELSDRCEQVVEEINDLRAERVERLHAEAPGLCATVGADGDTYAALWSKLHDGGQGLEAEATSLLASTERPYADALERSLRDRFSMRLSAARAEDVAHLLVFKGPEGMFRVSRLPVVYRDALAGIGIRTGAQAGVDVDTADRPAKRADAFCAPLRVPDDVRLVLRPGGGFRDVVDLLMVAGEGQRYALTSPSARPEFRLAGDPAAVTVWGALFASIARSPDWLAEHFGVEKSSRDLFRVASLARCHHARRLAGLAVFEAEVHSGRRGLAGAPDRYGEVMTEALGVEVGRARYLVDLGSRFEAASGLRALALEAQVRDHLMTRFGSRWWASRMAGALLKEIWAAGGEYPASSLASELGLGPLAFDALDAELREGLER